MRDFVSEKSLVKDYMTKDVISVKAETPTETVIKIMKESNHNSYPVVDDEDKLIGMVTAFDILLKDWADSVKDLMSTDLIVANEEMSIDDASRVMFRRGVSRLPVVDSDGSLIGIITNTDMVRSHIERTTPNKVEYFKSTLEALYGVKTEIQHMKVSTKNLRPTQDRVYADELEGRIYEIKRGLAEPVIVVKTGNRWILVDGHHRAIAARKLGCDKIDAYVINIHSDIELGLEKTADDYGVKTFDDIKIIDDAQHPLIAITESIKQSQEKK
ncbi:CBS domain-containing ParB/RepB/Spo0J family partition protein [Methanobrevibacter sp. DSM 116169]|uniref:CBS domain-containing ParB/RepB/Spo0J family partition protein n=1 Tax=Methanobrevibacter sp. DSM 116169 TaxID=3242727 RepID=UPI0038FBF157